MTFLRQNRIALLFVGLALLFLAIGVWRGEEQVVLRKAVNICMECIGLG